MHRIMGSHPQEERRKKVSSSLIQRGLHKFSIVLRLRDITIKQIIASKQTALHAYQQLKKNSFALCQTFIEELAAACAAIGNHSQATELLQLLTHEHQRALAWRIRHIYGQTKNYGVTRD